MRCMCFKPVSRFLLALPVVLFAPLVVADVNVSGDWAVSVDVPSQGQTGTPRLELNQMGSSVGGIYRGQFGERPVIGSVSGHAVELNFTIQMEETTIPVTYQGETSGDSIWGIVRFGDQAEGSFTAQRRE
jgi:hypothetical protein